MPSESARLEASARNDACDIYKKIEEAGLTCGSAGNISVRFGDDMLARPRCCRPAALSEIWQGRPGSVLKAVAEGYLALVAI
jgi:ribulose-5-phosphate 4-epimerase/fuculose-1-phosphate aldolase